MALPIIKYGDVFEIETSVGLGYFQCVKEAPANDLEIIRVFPGVYKNEEEADLDNLVKGPELYFLQFVLKYAVKKKCINKIGNFLVPENVQVPKLYRTKLMIRYDFVGWHIVDSETLWRRKTDKLSDEERRLSPWDSWNDTLLSERIASGWTLEQWT